MAKEKNQGITYLLELPTERGMMSLVMPLPRSRTTIGVTAPDIAGPESNKTTRATTTATASDFLPMSSSWLDAINLTKDGSNRTDD